MIIHRRATHPTHDAAQAAESEQGTMKTYTITAITKANRTEYFHAVTVEAENIKEAKDAAAEIIESALNRHAFRLNNATAAASVEYAQWIAERFNTTAEAVMQAASRPEGVDAYNFKPATVEAHAEAENPLTPGNAPLYAWTFANGAESAATLAAEASSHDAAIQYARAARTCANEATEAAKIAGTAEAAKDAERARIAADNAAEALALSAYETARREATKAKNAEHRTSYAANILESHSRATIHAEEAERHAAAAEQAAHEAATIAANAAARSFLAALEDATGHKPYDMDAAAVYRVARDELTGSKCRATASDLEAVAAMVEAIAAAANEHAADIAARAAFEARRPSLEEIKAEFSNPFLVW